MTIILVTFFVFTSLLPNSHGYGATFPDGKRQLEVSKKICCISCKSAILIFILPSFNRLIVLAQMLFSDRQL